MRMAGVIVGVWLLQVGVAAGRDGEREGMVGVGLEDWREVTVGAGVHGAGTAGAVGAVAGIDTGGRCGWWFCAVQRLLLVVLAVSGEWLLLVTGTGAMVAIEEEEEESREGLEEESVAMEGDDVVDTGLESGLLARPATREERRFRLERSSEVGVAVVDELLDRSSTGVATLLDGALLLAHEAEPPFRFVCSRESVEGLTSGIELDVSLLLAELELLAVLVVPELTRAFERGRFCAMV